MAGDPITDFGLSSDPFGEDGDFSYYYGGPYAVASLRLERALTQRRGFIVVTGDAGVGKSALVRSILERHKTFATTTVSCANAVPTAAIEQLLEKAEPLAGKLSATRRRAALLRMIGEARRSGKPIVFVVEDAHLAEPRHLEAFRVALNLDADVSDVVQVILVGRPRLNETLSARSLKGLASRVAARTVVSRLTTDEAAEFLKDRLKESGAEDPETVFTLDALMVIARQCEGILARCSTLARESMKRAADCDATVVTPEVVSDAATVFAPSRSDYEQTEELKVRPRPKWMSAPAGIAAGVLTLALIVAATQVTMMDPLATEVPDSHPVRAAVGSVTENQNATAETGNPRLARERTLREIFLADTPYDKKIKPPARPESPEAPKSGSGKAKPREEPAAARGSVIEKKQDLMGPAVPKKPEPVAAPTPAPTPARVSGHTPSAKQTGTLGLQVGAFRSLDSANELKDKLSRQFEDVYVSEVISGGDPLFRVRVGRLTTNVQRDALSSRLQAAGYPSFRVSD